MARAGPTPEQIEAARAVIYATGLYTTRNFLKELVEKFQPTEAGRARLLDRALVIDPLIGERVCIELGIPTGGTDASGSPVVTKLFLQFEPVESDFDIITQQEKVYAAAGKLSDAKMAVVRRQTQGQMS